MAVLLPHDPVGAERRTFARASRGIVPPAKAHSPSPSRASLSTPSDPGTIEQSAKPAARLHPFGEVKLLSGSVRRLALFFFFFFQEDRFALRGVILGCLLTICQTARALKPSVEAMFSAETFGNLKDRGHLPHLNLQKIRRRIRSLFLIFARKVPV